MSDIQGRTAFVTGAASGIGLAIARALLAAGARVAMADIDADALAREAAALGPSVATHVLDVTDRAAMAHTAAAVERDWGAVHILCNNAGLGAGGPLESTTFAEWDLTINVNLNAVFNGIHAFVPAMIAHGMGGHIVNTASMSGLVASQGMGAYTASKFAVVGLSEALRMDMAPYNIGVSILCPGFVRTNLLATSARHAPPRNTPPVAANADVARRIQQAVQAGIDAEPVGAAVIDAIRTNRLWIVTHPIYRPKMLERMHALLAEFPEEPHA